MAHIKTTILVGLLTITISVAAQEKKDGIISIQMDENDTMHLATATVTDVVSKAPLKDVDITFYVQRLFGLMKVGDGTTDSTGIVNVQFPKDVRADGNGKVIFIAKAEDNDAMNDTAFRVTLKPDAPYIQNKPAPRAIYARYAPWWLIITFALVVGIVWLLFVYVIYLIYRIKKASTAKIIFN